MDRGAWQATVHGVTRVRHNLATKPHTHYIITDSGSKSADWATYDYLTVSTLLKYLFHKYSIIYLQF